MIECKNSSIIWLFFSLLLRNNFYFILLSSNREINEEKIMGNSSKPLIPNSFFFFRFLFFFYPTLHGNANNPWWYEFVLNGDYLMFRYKQMFYVYHTLKCTVRFIPLVVFYSRDLLTFRRKLTIIAIVLYKLNYFFLSLERRRLTG